MGFAVLAALVFAGVAGCGPRSSEQPVPAPAPVAPAPTVIPAPPDGGTAPAPAPDGGAAPVPAPDGGAAGGAPAADHGDWPAACPGPNDPGVRYMHATWAEREICTRIRFRCAEGEESLVSPDGVDCGCGCRKP